MRRKPRFNLAELIDQCDRNAAIPLVEGWDEMPAVGLEITDSHMLIFIDTEYTGLGQRDPKLISLALVPADGRNEFYAEVAQGDGWTLEDCAEFVQKEVLPLLQGGACQASRDELRERLTAWFAAMPRQVQIACDSAIDFRFLKQVLVDCWPANVAPQVFDLRSMIDTTVFDQAAQATYTADQRAHNALADARANRRGWLAWMDAHKMGTK